MRWLLLKDLQILRRSPLLVAMLVAYPVIIAVLIGLALSRGPDKPKVAIVNELPAGQTSFSVGSQHLDVAQFAKRAVQVGRAGARSRRAREAVDKVRSGEVLGALIVPPTRRSKLQDAINLAGTAPPTVEVLYNAEDPIRAQLAESTIKARLADANKALSDKLTAAGGAATCGSCSRAAQFSLLGQKFDVLGPASAPRRRSSARCARCRPSSEQARDVQQVIDFAQIAIDNLGLSDKVLAAVGQPLAVKRTVIAGHRTPLDAFAVAVVGDRLAHVRHRPAGLGHARARARGARVRAARARARLAPGAAG